MHAYLANLADSDLFGSLALLCLLVAATGLFPKVRHSKRYFPAAFTCLMFMPVLHAIGSYFLSSSHP
jgi:hypothetical protein